MNTFYGIYLNDHKELRMIELEKRYSTIYSRDTLGDFRIPRYEDEFLTFIDSHELLSMVVTSSEKRKIKEDSCRNIRTKAPANQTFSNSNVSHVTFGDTP